MFRLIKHVFIVFSSFSKSLATKWMSLNNKPCMFSPTTIDLNHTELNFYPFMISLERCNVSCYVVDNLSVKMCLLSKTEGVSVKQFNMITRIDE